MTKRYATLLGASFAGLVMCSAAPAAEQRIGVTPGQGDTLAIGGGKINSNFDEIYARLGLSSTWTLDSSAKVLTATGLYPLQSYRLHVNTTLAAVVQANASGSLTYTFASAVAAGSSISIIPSFVVIPTTAGAAASTASASGTSTDTSTSTGAAINTAPTATNPVASANTDFTNAANSGTIVAFSH